MSSYRGIKTSSRSSILKEDITEETTTSPKQIVGIVLSFLGDMYTHDAIVICAKEMMRPNRWSDELRRVKRDVDRTFDESTRLKESCLYRILVSLIAFSCVAKNQLGYCQGMNFVAASMLRVLNSFGRDDEETCFWLCVRVYGLAPNRPVARRLDLEDEKVDTQKSCLSKKLVKQENDEIKKK